MTPLLSLMSSMEAGILQKYTNYPTGIFMTKIWQWAMKLKGSVMFNQATPLWLNPKVQEMHQVQDTAGWGI